MALSKELIDVLACPKCKQSITLTPKGDGLACKKCNVVYPVRDDIPIMLSDQAIAEQEWNGSK